MNTRNEPAALLVENGGARSAVRPKDSYWSIGVGFATMYLSVAAPPTESDHALHVAAEHFAFCPDNIWQSHTGSLTAYADRLTNRAWWSFWWD